MAVVIETTLGDITVDLYLDQRPVTCLNFLKLCKMKYYNYNLFHTIRSGFIAQTGDPTGEGAGGQSIWGILEGPDKRFFSGEKRPKIRHTDVGLLSMVCSEDMMVGSQFFITLAPDLDSLDGTHCVIGEVTEGHDVLTKLNEVICDESHRPYRDVRITHTIVLEDPFNDPSGLRAPSRSPSPNPERLKGGRIAPDEEIDETQGKSAEEIQEMIDEKEAKARATILEIVGDLPDADIAPPENVLFVCKLNPVTTDEDLEIIFSRFGKIVSCEVIRDKKTGNSLQYAFIEFENKKSCEDAYFKMDNVLIDDRRIHVDFSQSVSKMRWLGKGRGVQYFDEEPKKKSKDEDKRYRADINVREERENQSNGKRYYNSSNDRDGQHKNHKERERRYRNDNQIDRDYNRNDNEKERQNKNEKDRQHKDEKNRQHKDEKDRHYSENRERDRKNRDGREKTKHRRDRSRSRSEINYSHDKSSRNDKDKYTKEMYNDSSRSHRHKNDYNENNHLKSTSPSRKNKYTTVQENSDTSEAEKKEINRYQKDKERSQHKETKHAENKGKKHQQNVEPKTPSPIIMNKKDKTSKHKNVKKLSNKRLVKKGILKKKRKPSTTSESSDTTSSSDSSSSSESDNKNKKIQRKKRHYSTSSSSSSSTSSSSSSSSDSSSDSSSSSDGETRKRKHRKNSKQTLKKPKKKL